MHEQLGTGRPPRAYATPPQSLPPAELTEHEIRYQLYSPQVDDRLGIARIMVRLPQISPRILSDILVAALREPNDAVRQELSSVLGDVSRQMPTSAPLMAAWQDLIAAPDPNRGYRLPADANASAQLLTEREERRTTVARLALTDARLPLPLRVASAAALLRQGGLPQKFDEAARHFIEQKGGLPLLLAGAGTDLTSFHTHVRLRALSRLAAYAKRLPPDIAEAVLGRLDDPVVHLRRAALSFALQLDQAYTTPVRKALTSRVQAEVHPELQSMLLSAFRSPFRAVFPEVEQLLHALTSIARTNRQVGGSQQLAIKCIVGIATAWNGPPMSPGSPLLVPLSTSQRTQIARSVIGHLVNIDQGTQLDLQVDALRSAGELARQARAQASEGANLVDFVRRATLMLIERDVLSDEHREALKQIVPYTPRPPESTEQ